MAISAEHHNFTFFQKMHSSSTFPNEVLFIAYKRGKQDRKGRENINLLIKTRHSYHTWKSFELFNGLASLENRRSEVNIGGSEFWGSWFCPKQPAVFLRLLCEPVSSTSLVTLCICSSIGSEPFIVFSVFPHCQIFISSWTCKPLWAETTSYNTMHSQPSYSTSCTAGPEEKFNWVRHHLFFKQTPNLWKANIPDCIASSNITSSRGAFKWQENWFPSPATWRPDSSGVII